MFQKLYAIPFVAIVTVVIAGSASCQATINYTGLTRAQTLLDSGNPDSAAAILERTDAGILNPYRQWLLGNAYYRSGNFKKAYGVLSSLIKDFPSFPMWSHAYGLSGRCLYQSQDYERAARRLERFHRLYPDHPMASDCALDLARALAGSGRYDDALAEYRDVMMIYPNARTYRPASIEYQSLCDSLHRNPFDVGPGELIGWARVDLTNGRYDDLSKLAEQYWKNRESVVQSGDTLHYALRADLVGDYDAEMRWIEARATEKTRHSLEAKQRYHDIIDRYAGTTWAAQSYSALIAMECWQEDFEQAFEYLDRLEEMAPQDAALYRSQLDLGKALLGDSDYRRAYSVLKKLQREEADPSLRVEALWYVGWIDWNRQRYRAAAKAWTRLLEERPQDSFRPAAQYWQARALAEIKKPEMAVQMMSRLALEHPQNYYGLLARVESADLTVDNPQPLETPVEMVEDWNAFPDPTDTTLGARRYRLLTEMGLLDFAIAEGDSLEVSGGYRDWDRHRALLVWQMGPSTMGFLKAFRTLENSKLPPDSVARILFPIRYQDLIGTSAARWQVPEGWILAMMRQESAFDQDSRSIDGAIGLLQVLPSTAEWIAKKRKMAEWEKLSNPRVNIEVGSAFFGWLLDRFDGAIVPAIAAHNAGQATVERWWQPQGADLAEWIESIPYRETRQFVKRVLTNGWMYAQLYPDRVGFQVVTEEQPVDKP